MKLPRFGFLVFMLFLCGTIRGAGKNPSPDLYTQSFTAFAKSDLAQRSVNFTKPDTNLLSAAVFHETNRRRKEHKLPEFKFHPRALQAAALQSDLMRKKGEISHENPESKKYRTLEDRLKASGLEYKFAAENVATAFGLRYESGAPFYKRVENGRTLFSLTPDGPPIQSHSYLSFARALVDSWMNSPGHRKNILNPAGIYLGASCLPAKSQPGMPIFYCTQVFFSPMAK